MATVRTPAPTPEEGNQEKLYKRILYMHGQKAQNQNDSQLAPQAEFKTGEIYAAYNKLKADFEVLEAKASGDLKPHLEQVKNKLDGLENKMQEQFNRWMKGYPCEKNTKWDSCFKEYNAALEDLKSQPKANDVKKEINALNASSLQDTAFNKEMVTLHRRLTEQSNTNAFSIRRNQALSSDPYLQRDFWEKLNASDADTLKKNAEKKADEALVNINGDDEINYNSGQGAGVYRKRNKGSDYFMHVTENGALSATYGPEDGISTKALRAAAFITLAPLLLLAIPFSAMREDKHNQTMENLLDTIFGRHSFEKSFNEMLDFLKADPSGKLGGDKVIMSFKRADGSPGVLREKHANQILSGLEMAKARGLDFGITEATRTALLDAVADGRISSKKVQEIFKAIKENEIEFEARKISTEKAGAKSITPETDAGTPTPPPTPDTSKIKPLMTEERLNEIVKLTSSFAESDFQDAKAIEQVDMIREAQDNIKSEIENIGKANQNECNALNNLVETIQAEVKKQPNDDNIEVMHAALNANEAKNAIDNRIEEIQIQSKLEANLETPQPEGAPAGSREFRDVVNEAVESLNNVNEADLDNEDKREKVLNLNQILKDEVVSKLHPEKDLELVGKIGNANHKFDDMVPPAPAGPAPK